jgi:hypothetical protein
MAERFYGSKAHANMPTEAVQKDWPKAGNPMTYGLDDTITGIDKQIEKDLSKAKKQSRKA